MLIDQFFDVIVRIVSLLLFDSINILCFTFLFLNTFGYVLFLHLIARISHKHRSTEPNIFSGESDQVQLEESEFPLISFIIPVYNEEETIEKKLENTLSLNYPKGRLEVLVVDDGSTDKTLTTLKRIQRSWFPRLKIIRQNRKGKSSAENYGLRSSKGDIVVISDADVPLNSNALRFMIEDFKDPKVGGVTCVIHPNEQCVFDLNISLGVHTRKLENKIDSVFGMSGPFVSFRKSIMPKIDEGIFSSDADTGIMIRKKGYRVILDSRIVSYVDQWVESHPRTLLGALKKLKHMSFGCMHLLARHKDILFKNRYGVFGWIIAPRHLFVVFAPIVFMLLSINSIIKLVNNDLLVPFLTVAIVFLVAAFLSRKIYPNAKISKALFLVLVYIVSYYTKFWYYLLFVLRPGQRKGMWSKT